MELDLNVLRPQERASLQLRLLYEQEGFRKYHMGRFEEYGLYQENRRFLSSEQVITFTDLDGRLLALKPDVTLSIAKNAQVGPGGCGRYYYQENVYRPSQESHTFREISQMGLECIGAVDDAAAAQVVSLALRSLALTGRDFVLEISHMGFVTGLFDAMGAQEAVRPRLLTCIRDKNVHELRKAAEAAGLSRQGTDALCRLGTLAGPWQEVLAAAEVLALNAAMGAALEELRGLCRALEDQGQTDHWKLDFSLVNDMEYYNGLVLQGYLAGAPRAVLRGGQYDPLAEQFRPGARAIGFALYLDELDRLSDAAAEPAGLVMLNVALPKGRLGDKVYDLLAGVGYGCPENYADTRKLVVENRKAGIRYFLVKPSDVAIYVEHGAADIGIVGKDILAESGADVYELLDTGLGRCRMCVAGPKDFTEDQSRALRVATKFGNIAKRYYAAQGRDIDIIQLNGSIELAPILGLSDVIVDIVETGTTLRENDLKVLTEFMPISARFIANRASYQFKHRQMDTMLETLREYTRRFDGADLERFEVTAEELRAAWDCVDGNFRETLRQAADNIRHFHEAQVHRDFCLTDRPGVVLGQRYTPVERVGICVPGSPVAFPSTILMNVIPARIAGVKEIAVVTPPNQNGAISAEALAAVKIAGADRVFKIGGAQAVAALAYGTETVPQVDKIVGPGGVFVAAAKRKVFGQVDIDMIAGPSEILVVADGKSDPAWVAADLLSQAEHDAHAAAVLVTDSRPLAEAVQNEVERQLTDLPRRDIAQKSLEANGKILVTKDLAAAVEAANRIAPEHLELCVDDPFALLPLVKNAGSVFLGRHTPEALGDYFAGPNHTLPTSGTARFSSPLSVDDFVKKTQFIYYTREALADAAPRIADFAEREGLHGHARSALSRTEEKGE